jgi:hypothetical protein
MARALIPLSDCGLLSRRNARRYCGCLGEEKFDREVGPHVRARLLGREKFYSRKELDAWIDGSSPAREEEDFLELVRRANLSDPEPRNREGSGSGLHGAGRPAADEA